MLTTFEVQNFKNFSEKLTFNLKDVRGYEFNKDSVKNDIVKNAIIYGKNGEGKSNLGFALFDIVQMVSDRNSGDEFYKHYLSANVECDCAEFKYVFEFDKHCVLYKYGRKSRDEVIYEEIFINGEPFASLNRNDSSIAVFNIVGSESLDPSFENSKITLVKYIVSNAKLDLSVLANEIFDRFVKFVYGMLFFRSVDGNVYIGFEQGRNDIGRVIFEMNAIEEFKEFMASMGISSKFDVIRGDDGEVNLVFDFGKKKINFSQIASSGTKTLLLVFYWFLKIKNAPREATLIYIDEFDAFYHNDISLRIIDELKKMHGQVFLTTHNSAVFSNEILRPDCYFILKDKKIKSIVNLADKEIREAHNLEKMYRSEFFG
jgi:AAA15 family ATPase/GTPase